jgi:hypothetical protein
VDFRVKKGCWAASSTTMLTSAPASSDASLGVNDKIQALGGAVHDALQTHSPTHTASLSGTGGFLGASGIAGDLGHFEAC